MAWSHSILLIMQKNYFDIIYDVICEKYNPHIYGDCNIINATASIVFKNHKLFKILFSENLWVLREQGLKEHGLIQ